MLDFSSSTKEKIIQFILDHFIYPFGIIRISLFCLAFILTINIFAQSNKTNEALARQYYLKQDYDKAANYYEKLYNNSKADVHYYQYLLKCYVHLKQYNDAEKLIKSQQKNVSDRLKYDIDLGYIYQLEGKDSKAERTFKKVIKDLPANEKKLKSLAEAFKKIEAYDYALKIYNQSKKLLGHDNFNMERANIYSLKGDYSAMVNQYLDLLNVSPAYMQKVKNAIQFTLKSGTGNKNKEVLKHELLKRIQKHPEKSVYSELLIWYYIQEKNFRGAFIQVRALDRRGNKMGAGVFKLASIASKNEDYGAAINCYNYIIKTYPKDDQYVILSKINKVTALYSQLENNPSPSQENLNQLKLTFETVINDLGIRPEIAPLLREQAKFYVQYLHQPEQATNILQKAIHLAGVEKHDKAKSKLQLADVLVFEGKVWNAALLYGQVETDFKYGELGDQAKFKNARISFYTGNFKWAKAQLDVLKASTSKLIANNAMRLSLLISDNTTLDTNSLPLKMYAQASLLSYQREYDKALQELDKIDSLFPEHSLSESILIEKGKIMQKEKRYQKAITYFEQAMNQFPDGIWADNTLYILGKIYEDNLNDKAKAMEAYKKLMTDYKSSIFVESARRRYRALRGDNIGKKQPEPLEN